MVYFIQAEDGGPIKIGCTSNAACLRDRLSSLQSGNPKKLVVKKIYEGYKKEEKFLHKKYSEYRIRNSEWFEFRGELKDLVEEDWSFYATEPTVVPGGEYTLEVVECKTDISDPTPRIQPQFLVRGTNTKFIGSKVVPRSLCLDEYTAGTFFRHMRGLGLSKNDFEMFFDRSVEEFLQCISGLLLGRVVNTFLDGDDLSNTIISMDFVCTKDVIGSKEVLGTTTTSSSTHLKEMALDELFI